MTEDSTSLDALLNFSLNGSDTVLEIDLDGDTVAEQTIILANVDLTNNGTYNDQEILDNLLVGDNLDAV